jgi:hypothetical protein
MKILSFFFAALVLPVRPIASPFFALAMITHLADRRTMIFPSGEVKAEA